MRYLVGWLAGIATAWAALAIWRRVPPLSEVVWEPEPGVEYDYRFNPPRRTVPSSELIPRRGDRRPGYDDSVAGWPPPVEVDRAAFTRPELL
ncbi:hypothetical protein SEA_HERMEONYSUS_18 [Microbacterium phage Hermeonysus]|nr:hypothetical protein SEA_BUSEPHILIS_19 [Microbacterium phage Busephilis]WKW86965.1 hypothetical protein SEA_HERMEONYSUS_18 [Microbacterium phage Hermeonysus]